MAVDSWTAEGMDWTVDHTGDPDLWTYGEALRLAITERAVAVGVSIPSSLGPAVVGGHPLRIGQSNGRPSWYYANDFDYLMTSLIPLYVNHTNLGGDWSGQAVQPPAPAWTESDILTAIGAGSRLYQNAAPGTNPKTHRAASWAWMKQQYDLLNMLRWSKQAAWVDDHSGDRDGEFMGLFAKIREDAPDRDTPEEAWAIAKATAYATWGWYWNWFGGQYWFQWPSDCGYYRTKAMYVQSAGSEGYYRVSQYVWAMFMKAWRLFQRVQPMATGISTSVAHSAQLYARTVKLPFYKDNYVDSAWELTPVDGVSTYVDPNGRAENHYFVQQEWPPAAISRHLAWVGPDPRLGPPTEPWCDIPIRDPGGIGAPDKQNVIGSQIEDFTYVLKWDVANGFQFVT